MPELPETETIARDLHEMVVGAVITGVTVPRPDVLREAHLEGVADALLGRPIRRVWRRAKLIVLDFDARPELAALDPAWRLVVQPRFTGGLVVDDGSLDAAERAYVCVTLTLGDGRALHYRDVRRLGTVALMDQKRLAGVGNIYANEALWHAGIDPSREARTLSAGEYAALRQALQQVLTASIAARGTSFRDYRDARGERGRFVEQLAAYGRAGAPCRRCGRRLVGTHAVDGRSTVFCPGCQY